MREKNAVKGAAFIISVLLLLITTPGLSFGGEENPGVQNPAESKQLNKISREKARKIVVARVNGVDITMESLIDEMNAIVAQKSQEAAAPKGTDVMKKEALDRLIVQELAYQKATAQGLMVEQNEIDNAMTTIKLNLGGEEGFKKLLEREGVTEKEFRAAVGRNLTVKLIFAKEVRNKIVISEDDLRREYEKEKDKFIAPEKISVIDVIFFLKVNDQDSLRKAEGVLEKIKADDDKNPWSLSLDGTFIVRNMGLNKEKGIELYEAAKKLKVGEVSGVIRTPDSLHIIKLDQYTPEKQFTFEEVKGVVDGQLRGQVQQQRRKEWEAELRKEAKIEILETKEGTRLFEESN